MVVVATYMHIPRGLCRDKLKLQVTSFRLTQL